MNELANSISEKITQNSEKQNITQDIEQTATQAINDPKVAQNIEQSTSQAIEQGKEIIKNDANNISKLPIIENSEKIASAQLDKMEKLQTPKQLINKQLPAQQAVPPPQPQNSHTSSRNYTKSCCSRTA